MPELGDKPIEDQYRELMSRIAHVLDVAFNGEAKGADRKVGFILMVTNINDDLAKGRVNYISNGLNRDDVVTMMKEQIKKFEGQPEVRGRA